MDWDDALGWGALLIVVLGILGGAYTAGLGPGDVGALAQRSASSSQPSASGGSAGSTGGSGGGGAATPAATGEERDIDFDIRGIEKCGTTCRTVTVTLENTGGAAMHDVSVTARLYTGGDEIWSDRERVGTLEANDSYTATKRVTVGYGDGVKIKANGGRVTVEAVVRSDQGTEVFRSEKKVA